MNKKSTSCPAMRTTIMLCALVFVAGNAFGLGMDYPDDRPVNNEPSWPVGMVNLVNSTNRVGGLFVNEQETFFFSGTISNFDTFLGDYSKIQGIEKHRLILHEGRGEAFSLGGGNRRPCDWELDGCPRRWRDLATLASHATNSLELAQQANQGTNYAHVLVGTNGTIKIIGSPGAIQNTNYILEVHFWNGGKIPLDQVNIPKNVEIQKSQKQ